MIRHIKNIYSWVSGGEVEEQRVYTKTKITHTIIKYVQVCMWAEMSKSIGYVQEGHDLTDQLSAAVHI